MTTTTEPLPVEDINLALRLYRRLVLCIILIVIVGLIMAAVLAKLSPVISPPYGVRFGGMDLSEWWLCALLVLVVAEIFWDGNKIGRLLKDPVMRFAPAIGLMSLPTVIAQRATAVGMRPGRFMGPLKPIINKRSARTVG